MAVTLYCTPDDVRGLHKNIQQDTDTFDDPYLNGFIKKATIRINEHLRSRYKVPLPADSIPEVIQSICADMAASFVLQNHFSGIMYREDTPLAEVYRKRAQADLEHVVDEMTLDGLPGIMRVPPEVPEQRVKVASTTPQPSPLQGRIQAFDAATRGPILSGRWPN